MYESWETGLNDIEYNKRIDSELSNEEILNYVMEKSNNFWTVKFVHASGHGWQHKDHGNSKAQLTFDVAKFFEEFDPENNLWNKFVEIFGKKNIHHDGSSVVMENQTERSAQRNKEKVLHHLRWLLWQVLEQQKDRKPTKVPHHEKKKRTDDKKHNGKRKENRKKPDVD